jgi:hypothetical protein
MIGLLATYFVVAYLLVPSGLFRAFYALSLPGIIKFQRTRVEEFTFAVLAALLPFLLALTLVWTVADWPFPMAGFSTADRRDAYRTVIGTAISDKIAPEGAQGHAFWAASNQVIRRQARFLIWYYIFVVLESLLFAWLTHNYGRWSTSLTGRRRRTYVWTAKKILLPSMTQWHALLTPFAYPPEPLREVWVDVLTTIDILYKGHVVSYFLDKEGELSGVFLAFPRRFDRQGLLKDRENNRRRPSDEYWTTIPSNNLYIPSDKIVNLNVLYLTESEATALRTSWLLEGLDVEAES